MKKIYLLVTAISAVTLMSAQVIESDNYNSYTAGDVGTNFAFGAPGQGGIYLNGGTAPDYQIANIDAAHGLSFQVMSGATATTASNRQAVKAGYAAAWAARTTGNDIVKVEYEVYTGTSTGAVNTGFNITNAGGGIIGLLYSSSTKTFTGYLNMTSTTTNAAAYYSFSPGATTYPANTWVKVGYTYDKVNGIATYTIAGVTNTFTFNGLTTTKNLDGTQFNMVSQAATGNTATNTSALDNYTVQAVNSAVLGTKAVGNVNGDVADINIYPNPSSDFVNVKSSSKIQSVSIVDVSGKVVSNNKLINNQIDVRNLPIGSYIINIQTEGAVQSKKFIKK